MPIKSPKPTSPGLNPPAILKGSLLAVIIAVVGSIILAVFYHFSSLSDSTIPLVSSVLLLISVFCGGYAASGISGCKGILHGLGVGLAVFLLIWILAGALLSDGFSMVPLFKKLLICILGGIAGGILGVGR